MVEANEVVAPQLGLTALPAVDWPDDQPPKPTSPAYTAGSNNTRKRVDQLDRR
jgi:hypothetical protein